ncbi:phage major capsid protein [Chachezhania antarctica]|uniref:phage major capsid protein n=1 Tax=Chachezhania antarctica TaxID=2340860 RepID=UPI000EAD1A56|nr:phage major capsid protein [Chachezhania antarctica]|tara:strand:- start:110 stop:1291 length:1182 start_codon:yes stop_codon:yes gene_type:complete
MSKTETPAAAGQGAPMLREVKEAMAGFVQGMRDFQDDVETKFQQTEERLTMLDRKSHISARPHLAGASDATAPHTAAFDSYVRTGDDDALRGLELEGKAMSTAVNSDGGYLVDSQTTETIRSILLSTASLRSVASVVNVEATSFDVLIDHSDVSSGWQTEAGTLAESSTPVLDRISIPLYELSALPKASQRLLDDAAFDVETWLAGRIANTFARAEAASFINGDGSEQPRGFLDYAIVENDSWGWDSLGYIPTGTAGGVGNGDAIADIVYALGAVYRSNGTFVMNSKTAGMIRKLKDADDRFLWADGLAAAQPARLMGYPVLIAEDMPDPGVDAFPIAFGDFRAGYTVAERPDIRILRDPFSAKPHVLFYATKRVGGGVTDFAAIKLLKFGIS